MIRHAIAPLAAMLLLVACGGADDAPGDPAASAAATTAAEDEVLVPDAEFYAREFGVSLEEAKRRLRIQSDREADALLDEITEAAGERYVTRWLEHEPEFTFVVVGLSGEEPASADVVQIVERATFPVEVRTGLPTVEPNHDAAIDPALMIGAEAYAEAFGVSLDEANRRLDLIHAGVPGQVIERIRDAAGDRFAAAWYEHTGEFRIVTVFHDGIKRLDAVYPLLEAEAMPIEIMPAEIAGNIGLIAERARILPLTRALLPHASSAQDDVTGAIVFYLADTMPEAGRLDEIQAELEPVTTAGIRFEVSPGPPGYLGAPDDPSGWPVALWDFYGGAALEAALSGTLVLDDGCLYVGNGDYRTLPVFPAAFTSWDAERQVLTLFGKEFAVGAEVFLGGAGMGDRGWADERDLVKPPPPGCDTSDAFRVFSGGDPPESSR